MLVCVCVCVCVYVCVCAHYKHSLRNGIGGGTVGTLYQKQDYPVDAYLNSERMILFMCGPLNIPVSREDGEGRGEGRGGGEREWVEVDSWRMCRVEDEERWRRREGRRWRGEEVERG